ncbi:MAG: helicase-related protein [Gammaproteobacteria bacterium]
MPNIYDNTEDRKLADAIRKTLRESQRADFCVGYFNLRGWRRIVKEIDALPRGRELPPCRLIVGMRGDSDPDLRKLYAGVDTEITQQKAFEAKKRFARALRQQLTWGTPTLQDERALRKLAKQLRGEILQVKFFGAYPLHAKLYLAHRNDQTVAGYVGSSNLTLAGLEKQGELNLDVLDRETTEKLTAWFAERWEHQWCLDISTELADIIQESWAGGVIPPYHIYIKTAYELSKEAIEGLREFNVPREFNEIMMEFQKQAVSLAARHLNRNNGVIIGDVVGLGKTLVASAVAKIFQEDRGGNVLVICPPKLQEMWDDYLHKYTIAGNTFSLGRVSALKKERRYRLVIIDESHNLRNRDSRRYAQVRDYIRENDSHVILLTATPYNKQFTDISNQLRLFVNATDDIGVRPEAHITKCGGAGGFSAYYPNTPITSLAAFEKSKCLDDWRELIRMFAVRRTRSHIKSNFAKYDEEQKRHYLPFADDARFYLPERKSKCEVFSLKKGDPADQYARLYSTAVVDIIGNLKLPRYGIGIYLLPQYQIENPAGLSRDKLRIIENLSRAGSRLIGFAKSNLFKRLESSGPAFLLTIKRHIVRNAVFLSALEKGGEFPIGNVTGSLVDETAEEHEGELFSVEWEQDGFESFMEAGRNVHATLISPTEENKFDWIESGFFNPSMRENLLHDCRELMKVLDIAPQWNAAADRKLGALAKLCREKHKTEKLLVFTQFKDTADYLFKQLDKQRVDGLAEVFGGTDDISGYVKRFSPVSNNAPEGRADELRVLITTDTLSEGQNLQDAHIVVNFDLPWAIIRLVQRAGRVDRIGQQSKEVLCYSFLPEQGIENIIALRARLQSRLAENAQLVGSDEIFFEGDRVDLQQLLSGAIDLEGTEDETDLISRAYDIWRRATKDNPALKKKITDLPDVVYSAKRSELGNGAIAYIKTNHNQHILARLNDAGEVVSQSQSKMLDWLECEPEEPAVEAARNHHKLVAAAVHHVKEGHADIGGQLGGMRSIRNRVYSRLKHCLARRKDTVFDNEILKQVVDAVFHHPLKETARDRIGRQLRAQLGDDALVEMVESMHMNDELCAVPKEGEPIEPQIICSMGLVGDSDKA